MKKENLATLILAAAGGIPFALGMCMCLVAQWGAFRLVPGIAVGVVGIVLLLSLIPVCRGLQ